MIMLSWIVTVVFVFVVPSLRRWYLTYLLYFLVLLQTFLFQLIFLFVCSRTFFCFVYSLGYIESCYFVIVLVLVDILMFVVVLVLVVLIFYMKKMTGFRQQKMKAFKNVCVMFGGLYRLCLFFFVSFSCPSPSILGWLVVVSF